MASPSTRPKTQHIDERTLGSLHVVRDLGICSGLAYPGTARAYTPWFRSAGEYLWNQGPPLVVCFIDPLEVGRLCHVVCLIGFKGASTSMSLCAKSGLFRARGRRAGLDFLMLNLTHSSFHSRLHSLHISLATYRLPTPVPPNDSS